MSTKFKKGDKVKAPGLGEGVVTEPVPHLYSYPVAVRFDCGIDEVFTFDGKLHYECPEPLLEKQLQIYERVRGFYSEDHCPEFSTEDYERICHEKCKWALERSGHHSFGCDSGLNEILFTYENRCVEIAVKVSGKITPEKMRFINSECHSFGIEYYTELM